MVRANTERSKSPRGIQSAAVAVRILQVFTESETPLHLREIAAAAGADASNVYRYLVSFGEAGMVRQQGDGRYDLGPLAIRLGLAALGRLDEFDVVTSELERLVEATRLDAQVTLWGTAGPTVARWRGRIREMSIRVTEGTVLPLTSSATGRIWSAYQSEEVLAPILDAEIARISKTSKEAKRFREQFDVECRQIRADGICASKGERRVGVSALCGPVFGQSGHILFSFTLMGPSEGFDVSLDGQMAQTLRHFLDATSRALGAKGGRTDLGPGEKR